MMIVLRQRERISNELRVLQPGNQELEDSALSLREADASILTEVWRAFINRNGSGLHHITGLHNLVCAR